MAKTTKIDETKQRIRKIMNANFIKDLLKRLSSLLGNTQFNSSDERLEEQPELVLRNPGPVVYLYKADAFYKLGRTRDVCKRDKQIKLQLPFRAIQIHVIHTNDEVWLEKYWHKEFAEKRRNGEWFELDADDVARFCSQDEMLKPIDVAQHQLDFEREKPQPEVVLIQHSTTDVGQSAYKTTSVQEVESHYRNLIALHPTRANSLEVSRKYQIAGMDAEVSRLQLRRGYSEIQAMQEWKRKAIMAADAKTRPPTNWA